MVLGKRLGVATYIITDFITAIISWILFFFFRKIYIDKFPITTDILQDENFIYGIIIIPICWIIAFAITGFYSDIYRKSRFREITKTFGIVLAGSIIIFFALLLDDSVSSYKSYYQSFSALLFIQFSVILFGRVFLLTIAKKQLKSGKVSYKSLIIGGNKNGLELYEEINERRDSLGYNFIGFIDTNGGKPVLLDKKLDNKGTINDLDKIIVEQDIEQVVIAVESNEHDKLKKIIDILSGKNIIIKIIPDMYNILTGSVKMNHVFGAILIEINPTLMPTWQKVIKRAFDVSFSSAVLLVASPIYAYCALMVKVSSKGPIFYLQERIGLNGEPFDIIKYRSMKIDAEKDGPALSSDGDDRRTKWGTIMRKWRLDEIPQFWNVLRGDMSIIGPRPERQFFIDKIVVSAPHYRHLHKVKPGITSWGQVKYGYASSVEEMIKRMKYDIMYIENMSLALDFKILFYTIYILTQGRGK